MSKDIEQKIEELVNKYDCSNGECRNHRCEDCANEVRKDLMNLVDLVQKNSKK